MRTNSVFEMCIATVFLHSALLAVSAATALGAGITERVSVASDGTQLTGRTAHGLSMSADGGFVAFVSQSPDQDTFRMCGQILVREQATHTTEMVSSAVDATPGNDISCFPSISGGGRFVAFESNATNLVADDTNGVRDVFVRDRVTGRTELVSVASDGTLGNHDSSFASISGDGRFVAFSSLASNLVAGDSNGVQDVFVRDRVTGTTERVSVGLNGEANGDSVCFGTAISRDGHYIAFHSAATNLVPDDTNGKTDVFLHDRVTGTTERVSLASNGAQGDGDSGDVSISADGRFVAFDSRASNLVADDTNGKLDVFVRDRLRRTTERVSLSSKGSQAEGTAPFDALSLFPSISADGRFVAFSSLAMNLVAGDTNDKLDVFLHDRVTRTTERVSIASDGTQGNAGSGQTAISGDARFVAFFSLANNLVPGDSNAGNANDGLDVFLRDRQTNLLVPRISINDVSVLEGPAGSLPNAKFTVSLSTSWPLTVTATFWTDNGTARAGSDYIPTGGTIAFAPGETSKVIAVQVIGDNVLEPRETFVLNLDVPVNAVIADGQGVCTILNDDFLMGTFELMPTAATVAVHERLTYAFTWTVPEPLNWHHLKDLQLRIRDGADTILWVRFDEASNTFTLFNEESGQLRHGVEPGSPRLLQTPEATLHMADTSAVGSGPIGPSVTLNLSLSFKPRAAGHTYIVEVSASDDRGNQSGFAQAGTLTITRAND